MREEILAGIKNAMDRGSTLEQAMQSFINAGYNPAEVHAVGKEFSTGASGIIYQKPEPAEEDKKETKPLPKIDNRGQTETKKKGGKKLVVISIVLALLIFLSAIGFLIYTLVK